MNHLLPSNGQVPSNPGSRHPHSPSPTETLSSSPGGVSYTSSPGGCYDLSTSGPTIPLQRLRYASQWGVESIPHGSELNSSQTPPEFGSDDQFVSFCNNQTTLDVPPYLMRSCSDGGHFTSELRPFQESQDISEWFTGSCTPRLEKPATVFYTTTVSPPPPSFSPSSCQSLKFSDVGTSDMKAMPEADEHQTGSGTDEDSNADPPYSLLIYQALRSAPGMKLPLQGIYSWFEKNTAKGKDQNSKGWQNSIRHNLSMNAGFEAVRQESAKGKKAVNFWRLTEEAAKNGIQSTTRFRKANCKKTTGSDPPVTSQRQRSGAKGSKAMKNAPVKHRNDEPRKEPYPQRPASRRQQQQQQQGEVVYPQHQAAASQFHVPTPLQCSPIETFDLGSIVGCAEPPACLPVFCDLTPWVEVDCLAPFDNGILGWCGLHTAPGNNGFLTCSDTSGDFQMSV